MASQFSAVVLTGPRQSGNSTILQHLFGRRYHYVSLELPNVRASAEKDPPPVIFDEAQYAPDLLPYIKEKSDADRHRSGWIA